MKGNGDSGVTYTYLNERRKWISIKLNHFCKKEYPDKLINDWTNMILHIDSIRSIDNSSVNSEYKFEHAALCIECVDFKFGYILKTEQLVKDCINAFIEVLSTGKDVKIDGLIEIRVF